MITHFLPNIEKQITTKKIKGTYRLTGGSTEIKFSDFKCGFEYETLVYTNQDLKCNLRSRLNDIYSELFIDEIKKNVKIDPPSKNRTNMNKLLKLKKKYAKLINDYVKMVFAISLFQTKNIQFIINTPIDETRIYAPPDSLTVENENWLKTTNNTKGKWLMTIDRSVKVTERIHTYLFKSATSKRIQRAEIEDGNICSLLVTHLEIVSPILSYIKDIKDDKGRFNTFFAHLESLPTVSFWNNKTSSNHVHISYGPKMSPSTVFKQCIAWYVFEPLIMTMVLPDRRNNKFCKLMRRMVSLEKFMKIYSKDTVTDFKYLIDNFQIIDPDIEKDKQRYVAFNILNLLNDEGKRTIEIRLKHGSTSIKENRAWIMFIVHFMHKFANSDLIDIDNYYFKTLLEFPYHKLIISKVRVEQPIVEHAINAVIGSNISNFNQIIIPLIKEMFEIIIPNVKLSKKEYLKDYLLELVLAINKKWKVII